MSVWLRRVAAALAVRLGPSVMTSCNARHCLYCCDCTPCRRDRARAIMLGITLSGHPWWRRWWWSR